MRILAFDTATRSLSVAVMEDGRLLAEKTTADHRTHSMRLMPWIDASLQTSRLRMSDIDGFAVTVGPGSFTGLRIGISTVKGLVAATAKPVVGVSTLDALAHQSTHETGLICPMLDARKAEVYCCRYLRTPSGVAKVSAEICSPPAGAVAGIDHPCVFIGDGAVAYRRVLAELLGEKALFAQADENVLRAGTVARIAWRRLARNDGDDPAALSPSYIRASDAQIDLKKLPASA